MVSLFCEKERIGSGRNQSNMTSLFTFVAILGTVGFVVFGSANFANGESPPLPSSCDKAIDMIVAIDSSGSVYKMFNNTIDFSERLISNFVISDEKVNIGIIDFSMIANAWLPLQSGTNLGKVYQVLEELRHRPQNGETHIDLALQLALKMFRESQRKVPKALVIITDGELTSGNYFELDTSLYELAVMKVFNYIVKEGDIVNEGVHKLASKPEDYFIFDITPNAMTSRFATQALTGGICLDTGSSDFDGERAQEIEQLSQNVKKQKQQAFEAGQQQSASTQPQQAQTAAATSQSQAAVDQTQLAAPQQQVSQAQQQVGITQQQGATQQAVGAMPSQQVPIQQQVPQTQPQTAATQQVPAAVQSQTAAATQPLGEAIPEQPVPGQPQVPASQQLTSIVQPQQGPTQQQAAATQQQALAVKQQPEPQQANGPQVQAGPTLNQKAATQQQTSALLTASAQVDQFQPQAASSQPNLQQPMGNAKQTYPETPQRQPSPALPVDSPGKVEACNINYTKVGCYNDFGTIPKPLPLKILEDKKNGFSAGVNSPSFDKAAWEKFLPDFICRCANVARQKGLWTFGIQNYDECYSGFDEGRYEEDGAADPSKCKNRKSQICDEKSDHCAGEQNASYIYTVLTSKHPAIVKIEYD